MILLPLLGITWVFGVLAVNNDSIALAWIFTILNSLQVLLMISVIATTIIVHLLIFPVGWLHLVLPCTQE